MFQPQNCNHLDYILNNPTLRLQLFLYITPYDKIRISFLNFQNTAHNKWMYHSILLSTKKFYSFTKAILVRIQVWIPSRWWKLCCGNVRRVLVCYEGIKLKMYFITSDVRFLVWPWRLPMMITSRSLPRPVNKVADCYGIFAKKILILFF